MNVSMSRFALVAGLLLGHASASISAASSIPASSQAHTMAASCETRLGTMSVKSVPTVTHTHTIHDRHPVVVFTTTLDTVTVTPAESTETSTDYETTTVTSTASTVTETFSTTSTEYYTSIFTLQPLPVITTVSAVVSTTYTSTSTIPVSAGFTPIMDTLPPSATVIRRSLLEEQEECAPWVDDYQFPQEVVCHEKNVIKMTTVSTVTGSPVTNTAATPTTTVTVTNTVTSNSVVLPSDVSTTLSYSTTSTITETLHLLASTSTVTSTSTAVGAMATAIFHDACAANNIAGGTLSADYGSLQGKYINQLTFNHIPGQTIKVGNTASAYDCCVSCQESAACAMTYFWQSGSISHCYVVSTSVCSTSTYGTAGFGNVQSGSVPMSLSNGNCGVIVS
ncbi:unnamed protein product [Penicillium salamii]|uniref:Apple domain-containing protein n=1 Tax=Penicillium salamii TaxID=1612424 RepID=A0A9W4JGG5_9EURO|nr:unnamed protein product [Penicillium salamii]